MSKVVKTVAQVALPIAGAFFGGPLGGALGGAIGGALGGGGIMGAALGGITGYMGAGAAQGIVGTAAAHTLPAGVAGPQNYGSGLLGAVTGGGARALGNTITSAAAGVATDPSKFLMGIGNQLMSQQGAQTSEKAARIQADAIDRGVAANTAAQKPYTELGQNAANQIQAIQADPGGYVRNNPFYNSMADDAQRRLLANQAAKGKVGSGGTAAALQEQLLNLGNGLVQQQIGTLQNQVNTGAGAAQNVGDVQAAGAIGQGGVNAAGQVGAYGAYKDGYDNQIKTLLALQGLNKTPIYQPDKIYG